MINFFCVNSCGTHRSSFFLYSLLFKQFSTLLTSLSDSDDFHYFIHSSNCSSRSWYVCDIKNAGTKSTKLKLCITYPYSIKSVNTSHICSRLVYVCASAEGKLQNMAYFLFGGVHLWRNFILLTLYIVTQSDLYDVKYILLRTSIGKLIDFFLLDLISPLTKQLWPCSFKTTIFNF